MNFKDLLTLSKRTAEGKFKNKKITSKQSKREITKPKKPRLSRPIQKVDKGLSSRGYRASVGERSAQAYIQEKEFRKLQGKKNATVIQASFNLRKRDRDVLDEFGSLAIETTPISIFDSQKEIQARMEDYKRIAKGGLDALTSDALRGTEGYFNMVSQTLLIDIDEEIIDEHQEAFMQLTVAERVDFLKEAYELVREKYEDIRRGFETLNAHELAQELSDELRMRLKYVKNK